MKYNYSYNFKWHNAPQRQFIINFNAGVRVEVSDGEVREIQAGSIFFVEDLKGKGHYSQSIENEKRYSAFIPVNDDFNFEDIVMKSE